VRVEVKVPVTESARDKRDEAYDLETWLEEPAGRDAELPSFDDMAGCSKSELSSGGLFEGV